MKNKCLFGFLAALVLGCNSGPRSDLDLAPVQGTVTFKGQPLANAQVVFMPETPGKLPASGVTDDNGKYKLTTSVPDDGVTLGKHRVTIIAMEAAPAAEGGQPLAALPENAPAAKSRIPEKYSNAETSGLSAEVAAGTVTKDFQLSE